MTTTKRLFITCWVAIGVLFAGNAMSCEPDAKGVLVCADNSLAGLREAGGQARKAGQWTLAEQIFQRAVAQFPDQPAIRLDLAVVMIDQQQFAQAKVQLDNYRRRFGESEPFWLTRGYWHDKQGDFFNSLTAYDNALRINPRSQEAWRQKIITVNVLGMPDKALVLAREHPGVLHKEDELRLRMDSAAYAVRAAMVQDDNRVLRQERVHSAISLCDETLHYIEQQFPDKQIAKQTVRLDRLLVWELDNRHQAVLDEYAALLQEQAAVRDDTRVAVAQAALNKEQPLLAVELLVPVTVKQPQETNPRVLLFYAYLESEQFELAQATLDALMRDRPAWRYGQSDKVVGKGWDRVTAESDSMMLAAWGNNLDAAYTAMHAYVNKAPFNPHLQSAYGDIHYLRGWPRQAQLLYENVQHQQPDLPSMKSGLINTAMNLYDYKTAEGITQSLVQDNPDLKSTETHVENWAVHNMQEINATVSTGRSNSSVYGSEDMEAAVWWYSKPLDYRNRVFVHTSSSTGTFAEGKGQIDRYGVGWEQRLKHNDYTFKNTAEIHRSIASEADAGLTLTSDWSIDDRWSVYGALESFSSQLPVRAYNDGVTAKSAELSARYRVSERAHYQLSTTAVDFSDSNQRGIVSATGYQVFYSSPHHQWAVLETVAGSRNSQVGGLYFNPESDLEIGLATEYEGIIERDYDFEFRHRLRVGVGMYNQQNYGNDPTAQIDYEHRWQKDKALSWFYGVGFNYHPYDGDSELRESLYGGFQWRFD